MTHHQSLLIPFMVHNLSTIINHHQSSSTIINHHQSWMVHEFPTISIPFFWPRNGFQLQQSCSCSSCALRGTRPALPAASDAAGNVSAAELLAMMAGEQVMPGNVGEICTFFDMFWSKLEKMCDVWQNCWIFGEVGWSTKNLEKCK